MLLGHHRWLLHCRHRRLLLHLVLDFELRINQILRRLVCVVCLRVRVRLRLRLNHLRLKLILRLEVFHVPDQAWVGLGRSVHVLGHRHHLLLWHWICFVGQLTKDIVALGQGAVHRVHRIQALLLHLLVFRCESLIDAIIRGL
jgi:hypothetical protein